MLKLQSQSLSELPLLAALAEKAHHSDELQFSIGEPQLVQAVLSSRMFGWYLCPHPL